MYTDPRFWFKMTDVQRNKRKPNGKHKKFDHNKKFDNRRRRWQIEDEEIGMLKQLYDEIDPNDLKTFSDFPLSEKTKKGLQFAKYEEPTEIQHESILLSLKGNDILGAAKTGSGKTLAFIVPILELLFKVKWNPMDGLGALVITPTRELAYQIFEVLRKVGKFHDFSAGLVIGGKHMKDESERIGQTNIVICTPGRLLQHMDQTAFFHADNLQILVLDEADRILDMGFAESMNAIIGNLPSTRQTVLYSATQTKSVKDLARLSLKDPMYVSVHEKSAHSTPSKLTQSYVVCELHDKMSFLWSFIKNHLQSKILVFLSSCKQVRYVNEIFRRLRPGINVMSLHGAMQQLKRIAMYDAFVRKQHAVLFATDIAARGLDFPAVNWVIQMDCPEDANTYIHRAGRTARYKDDGEALLVLLPSEEEAMTGELATKKIPIEQIKVNPQRLWSIQGKMESLCASDITVKEYAQRAFVSYLKSVFLMSNKSVFDVTSLDSDKYARSLGLAISPRVRFIQKEKKRLEEKEKKLKEKESQKQNKHKTNQLKPVESESCTSDDDDSESEAEEGPGTRPEKDAAGLSDDKHESFNFGGGDDDDDDVITFKKKHEILPQSSSSSSSDEESDQNLAETKEKKAKKVSKAALAKKLMKKNITTNVRVVFDEEGEAIVDVHKESKAEVEDDNDDGGINIELAKQRMVEEDKFDKQLYREKIRLRHREERLKEKDKRRQKQREIEGHGDEEQVAVLGTPGEESADEGSDSDQPIEQDGIQSDEYDEFVQNGSENESESDDGEDEDDDDDEEDSQQSGSDDEDDDTAPPAKRSRKSGTAAKDFDTGLSLEDDEAIALKLLQS